MEGAALYSAQAVPSAGRRLESRESKWGRSHVRESIQLQRLGRGKFGLLFRKRGMNFGLQGDDRLWERRLRAPNPLFWLGNLRRSSVGSYAWFVFIAARGLFGLDANIGSTSR